MYDRYGLAVLRVTDVLIPRPRRLERAKVAATSVNLSPPIRGR